MKKTLLTIFTLILTVSIGAQIANAIGSLTPSGTAGDDTHYSLNDIYGKLINFGDTPTATSSPFTTPGSVSASFITLSEIYGLLEAEEDLTPSNIANGVTIFGVEGTLQGAPAALIWQTDPNLNLCWSGSAYEVSESCTIGNGSLTAEGYGAVEYCQNLVAEGSSDWRLPTASEYNSIVDFSTSTPATQVSGFYLGEDYWTSTLRDSDQTMAWYWSVNAGYVDLTWRYYNTYKVRCVR